MYQLITQCKYAIIVALIVVVSSCAKSYDDEFNSINDRLNSLETLTAQLNKDIATMQTIVKALESNDYITGVTELSDKSGYTITFSKSGAIIIKNGTNGKDAPVIGAKMYDGVYYWTQTINGVTTQLLGENGEPLPVSSGTAGVTPTLGVDTDGFWTIDLHDGNGVNRMKDANGKDVKAVGTNGSNGSNGSNGTHEISADGRYVTITLSGGFKYTVPYLSFNGFTFADGTGLVYVSYGAGVGTTPTHELVLTLPAGMKEADYSAISAEIKGKAGSDISIATKSITSGWAVEVTKPTFLNSVVDPSIPAKVKITSPVESGGETALSEQDRTAILTVTLVTADGNTTVITRPVVVTKINATDWATGTTDFTFTAPINTSNVLITVTGSIANGATLTIPTGLTAAQVPVITINVNSNMKFSGSLTINGGDYNGLVILQAQTAANEIVGGALTVTLPKGSFIIVSGTVTGTTTVSTKTNTFTIGKEAKLGAVKTTAGSLVVQGETAAITTSSPDPIRIEGKVADITVEAAAGGGAEAPSTPIVIAQSATEVGAIKAPKSDVKVEPNTGNETTKVGAIESATAEVGKGATVESVKATEGVKVHEGGKVTGEVEANEITVEKGGEVNDITVTDGGSVKVEEGANVTGDLDASKADPDNGMQIDPGAKVEDDKITPPAPANDAITIDGTRYNTLAEAINAAANNSTITVKPGKYDETLNIPASKILTIKGTGLGVTVSSIATASSLTLESVTITTLTTSSSSAPLTFGTGAKIGTINVSIARTALTFLTQAATSEVTSNSINGTPKYFWGAKDAAQLTARLAQGGNNDGTVLTADIIHSFNYSSGISLPANKEYILDGMGYTVTGVSSTQSQNVVALGGNHTLKNITLKQSGSTAINGITVFQNGGKLTTIENVTIQNCRKYALVINGSYNVAATNLSTSGNTWGGINIDRKSVSGIPADAVRLTLNDSQINDPRLQILAENLDAATEENIQGWIVGNTVTNWKKGYIYMSGVTGYVWSSTELPQSTVHNTTKGIGYKTLAEAITAASANDAIAINENLTLGETVINMDKALTITGNSKKLTFTVGGHLNLTANATINNLTIDATSKVGVGPITVNATGVILKTDGLKITQNTAGTGDGTATSGLGILVKEVATGAKLDLKNSDILLTAKSYQRGIAYPFGASIGTGDMTIDMDNCKIIATQGVNTNMTYSQGLGIAGLVAPIVNIKNCTFTGMYYPISCAGDSPHGMRLTIDNTVLTGYCALNLRGNDVTINIKNGSVLTGRNVSSGESDDFAAIIFNRNQASNNTLTIQNSTVKAVATGTALEDVIDTRANPNTKISITNSTLMDVTKVADYMIIELRDGSTVTSSGVTLDGKVGVQLYEK